MAPIQVIGLVEVAVGVICLGALLLPLAGLFVWKVILRKPE